MPVVQEVSALIRTADSSAPVHLDSVVTPKSLALTSMNVLLQLQAPKWLPCAEEAPSAITYLELFGASARQDSRATPKSLAKVHIISIPFLFLRN